MRFQCDRCGKRYSTGQEIRDGRTYSVRCRSCGHKVIVRASSVTAESDPGTQGGAADAAIVPTPTQTPAPVPLPQPGGAGPRRPEREAARPAAGGGSVVVHPWDLPPPDGGYIDLVLDDDPPAPPAARPAPAGAPASTPPPAPGATPGPSRAPPPTLTRTPPPSAGVRTVPRTPPGLFPAPDAAGVSSPGGSAGAARRSDTPTTGIEALELDPEPTGRSVAARPAVEGLIEVRDGAGVSDVIPGPAARLPVGGARDDAADARWRRNVVIAVGVTVAVAVVAVVASLAGGRRPVPSRGGGAAQPAAAVAAAPSPSPAALPPPTPAPQRVADAVPVVSAPAEAEIAVEVPPPDRGTSEPSPQRDAVEARPARSSARPARREEPAARKGAPAAKPTSAPARQQVATAKPAVPAAPSPPPQAAPASTAAPSHAAPPQPAPQIASNAPVSRPPAPLPAPVAAPGPTAAAPPAQAPAAQRADDARPGSEDVTKVVLRRDVEGLGRSGEVVEVPPGYARNFLVPKGLAAPAAGKRGRDAQPQRRPDGQGEEEPAFAGAGYRRPAPTTPQCVERNLRLPAEAVGGQPAAVTLRFAVGRTGVADLVDVQPGPGWPAGRRVGPRLVDALNAAVRGCRFTPGADEQGRPVRLWVVMQVPVSG